MDNFSKLLAAMLKSGQVVMIVSADSLGKPVVAHSVESVESKRTVRKFSASYKLSVLKKIEALRKPGKGDGAIGQFLAQEGLRSSIVASWKKAHQEGRLLDAKVVTTKVKSTSSVTKA